MKRFGVFVCPTCGQAFSKESKTKRSKCPRCEASIDVSKLFPIYQTDNAMKASEGVRQVNVGNLAGDQATDLNAAILQGMKESKGKVDDLTRILAALDSPADMEGLHERLPDIDRGKLAELVGKAMEEGLIFERSSGLYERV